MTSAFETWVQSAECFEILRICARQVSIRAERIGIVLDDSHIAAENRDDYLSAVASDLWQFIKGNATTIAQQATTLLVSGDETSFMTFISQKFLDHCIDERRNSNPFQNYYRKMRALLHKISEEENSDISYKSLNRKCSYYAYSVRTDLVILPDTLSGADYSTWSACNIPFIKLYDRDGMLGLSRHFWDESLSEFMAEYLLPIRELVSFVGAKYPLMLTVDYQDALDDGEENTTISLENRLVDTGAASNALDDSWKRQRPVIEADVIDTQLDSIACDCVLEMTDEERTVLVQLDAGEKLETIASSLKMKKASNVSYYQKKAYHKIHTKWSLWGPAEIKKFADVDEEEFFMFYEKVIGFCRKSKTVTHTEAQGHEGNRNPKA